MAWHWCGVRMLQSGLVMGRRGRILGSMRAELRGTDGESPTQAQGGGKWMELSNYREGLGD